MNKAIYTVGAAATLVGSSLLSSSASALCDTSKQYNGGTDQVQCSAQSDQGTNSVFRPGGGLNYEYVVGGFGVESFAQGILLNAAGGFVSGNRTNGTFGSCSEFFFVVGSGTRIFTCSNANSSVARIRVRVE